MYQDNLYQQFDARLRTISGIHEIQFSQNSEHRCRQDYWVLDYMVEGEGLFKTSAPGRPWRVRKKGEAHLYPPNTTYWERSNKQLCVKSCFIIFQCNDSVGLQNLIPSPDHYALFYDDCHALLKLFQKFDTAIFLSEEKQFLLAQSIFWEIILHLTACQPSPSGDYHLTSESLMMQKSQFIQDILLWINKNYTGKITMLDLTRRFGVSRTALYQRFLEETGDTPFTTINRLRLKHANHLILQGYKLKEIAEQTGFSSEYHLSKAYKKHFGSSPKASRNKTQKNF